MRQDQYERLQRLEEKLFDVFLAEADPDQWSGKGLAIASMDKDSRGDRYWCKRNAAATGALAMRVGDMIGKHQLAGGGAPVVPVGGEPVAEDGDDALEAEILSTEREAAQLMKKLRKGKT